jgi:hypothetical protein
LFQGDVEHDLHERFAAAHVMGEWFDAEPVLSVLPSVIAQQSWAALPLPCLCGECKRRNRRTRRAAEYEWATPTACEWMGTGIMGRPSCRRTPVASARRASLTSTRARWVAVCAVHAKQTRDAKPLQKRARRVWRASPPDEDALDLPRFL